jgi:hypothetical protein
MQINSTVTAPAKTRKARNWNWLIGLLGVLCLPIAWIAVKLQGVFLLGIFGSLLAPDIVMIGFAMIAWAVASIAGRRLWLRLPLFLALAFSMGMNSRLPSLLEDVTAQWEWNELNGKIPARQFQPLHIISNQPQISARWHSYDSAKPSCAGHEGCFSLKGFETPRHGGYWGEDIVSSVNLAGYIEALPGERAPTLNVTQVESGLFSTISMSMKDANGLTLATHTSRHRIGFPGETSDTLHGRNIESEKMQVEYLLHGNGLNSKVGDRFARSPVKPLRTFLAGIKGDPAALPEAHVEFVRRQVFDPPKLIKEDGVIVDNFVDPLAGSQRRFDDCKPYLVNGEPAGRWVLFVQDPTRRNRFAFSSGSPTCTQGAIWLATRGRTPDDRVLTKYSPTGEVLYSVGFKSPSAPDPDGYIADATLRASNGYLIFEWWRWKQSGRKLYLLEKSIVRMREPTDGQP